MRIISEKISKKEDKVFEFNDPSSEFQELDIEEDLPRDNLLDSESILLFIDRKRKLVWMWIGSNSTIRMKVGAANDSFRVRDHYAFGSRIVSVDEGIENKDFKLYIGLEKEEEQIEEIIEPQYKGTAEYEEIFESMTEERILLILEKTTIPEDYERRLVIVNNEIYLYKEYDAQYLGSDVRKKRLFSLKEDVEDGSYLLEGYTPRLLFSSNKVVLIDLLQKIEGLT